MKATLWFVTFLFVAIFTLHGGPKTPPPSVPGATPFRMIFKGYDGDPKVGMPLNLFSFQIDTIDLRQPSEFLKLGDMIPNTKFKLAKFVFKEVFDEKLKENVDVSELVIVNTVTGKTATLILNRVVDVSK